MNYYPLFLNLKNKKAAVFGAGKVALRKIKTLLEAGARVEVSSLGYLPEIKRLALHEPSLRLKPKAAADALLKDAALAFVATSNRAQNKRLAEICRRKKILVNVADDPGACDFIVPSHLKKGPLELAISTGGASPLLARKFRQEISRRLRPEAVRMISRMRKVRDQVMRKTSRNGRKKFFENKIGKKFQFLDGDVR